MSPENNFAALGAAGRAFAAIVGGYALTISFAAAATTLLQRGAGWGRGEAFVTAAMLAFVVYLAAALRAFLAPSARRAWGEPLAAAAALSLLAAVIR
jgi:hypothetical protein